MSTSGKHFPSSWKFRKSLNPSFLLGFFMSYVFLCGLTDTKSTADWLRQKGEMYWLMWLESPKIILTSGKAWSRSSNCFNHLASLSFSELVFILKLPHLLLPPSPLKSRALPGITNECLSSFLHTHTVQSSRFQEGKESLCSRNSSKVFFHFSGYYWSNTIARGNRYSDGLKPIRTLPWNFKGVKIPPTPHGKHGGRNLSQRKSGAL